MLPKLQDRVAPSFNAEPRINSNNLDNSIDLVSASPAVESSWDATYPTLNVLDKLAAVTGLHSVESSDVQYKGGTKKYPTYLGTSQKLPSQITIYR